MSSHQLFIYNFQQRPTPPVCQTQWQQSGFTHPQIHVRTI